MRMMSRRMQQLFEMSQKRSRRGTKTLLTKMRLRPRSVPVRLSEDARGKQKYWEKLRDFYFQREKDMERELKTLAERVVAASEAFEAAKKESRSKRY